MPKKEVKARYFLIGGNGDIEETIEKKADVLMPKISDDEIDKLYNHMIKFDAEHSSFQGTKRDYVYKTFITIRQFVGVVNSFGLPTFSKYSNLNGKGKKDFFPDTETKKKHPVELEEDVEEEKEEKYEKPNKKELKKEIINIKKKFHLIEKEIQSLTEEQEEYKEDSDDYKKIQSKLNELVDKSTKYEDIIHIYEDELGEEVEVPEEFTTTYTNERYVVQGDINYLMTEVKEYTDEHKEFFIDDPIIKKYITHEKMTLEDAYEAFQKDCIENLKKVYEERYKSQDADVLDFHYIKGGFNAAVAFFEQLSVGNENIEPNPLMVLNICKYPGVFDIEILNSVSNLLQVQLLKGGSASSGGSAFIDKPGEGIVYKDKDMLIDSGFKNIKDNFSAIRLFAGVNEFRDSNKLDIWYIDKDGNMYAGEIKTNAIDETDGFNIIDKNLVDKYAVAEYLYLKKIESEKKDDKGNYISKNPGRDENGYKYPETCYVFNNYYLKNVFQTRSGLYLEDVVCITVRYDMFDVFKNNANNKLVKREYVQEPKVIYDHNNITIGKAHDKYTINYSSYKDLTDANVPIKVYTRSNQSKLLNKGDISNPVKILDIPQIENLLKYNKDKDGKPVTKIKPLTDIISSYLKQIYGNDYLENPKYKILDEIHKVITAPKGSNVITDPNIKKLGKLDKPLSGKILSPEEQTVLKEASKARKEERELSKELVAQSSGPYRNPGYTVGDNIIPVEGKIFMDKNKEIRKEDINKFKEILKRFFYDVNTSTDDELVKLYDENLKGMMPKWMNGMVRGHKASYGMYGKRAQFKVPKNFDEMSNHQKAIEIQKTLLEFFNTGGYAAHNYPNTILGNIYANNKNEYDKYYTFNKIEKIKKDKKKGIEADEKRVIDKPLPKNKRPGIEPIKAISRDEIEDQSDTKEPEGELKESKEDDIVVQQPKQKISQEETKEDLQDKLASYNARINRKNKQFKQALEDGDLEKAPNIKAEIIGLTIERDEINNKLNSLQPKIAKGKPSKKPTRARLIKEFNELDYWLHQPSTTAKEKKEIKGLMKVLHQVFIHHGYKPPQLI
jgi:hypothetical protein